MSADRTRFLVIGRNGLVGQMAHAVAGGRLESTSVGTSRWRRPQLDGQVAPYFDLLYPETWSDFEFDVVLWCAAITGFAECEGNRDAWRINVDAPVTLARRFMPRAHFVFLSSGAVEWAAHTAYGRMKAHAELGLQALGAPCIVRPEKISQIQAAGFANWLVGLALERRAGIFRWDPSMLNAREAAA